MRQKRKPPTTSDTISDPDADEDVGPPPHADERDKGPTGCQPNVRLIASAALRPAIADVLPGVRRVTFPQVRRRRTTSTATCSAARAGWTLVDTGLGVPGAAGGVARGRRRPRRPARAGRDHPHARRPHRRRRRRRRASAGGPVLQGRLDRAAGRGTAYGDGWPRSLRDHATAHGMPPGEAAAVEACLARAGGARAPRADASRSTPATGSTAGRCVALPGHADGHIGLLRDGVLVGGDALLPDISPVIGVWPGCDPDPLAAYLATLDRIVALAPRVVLPGHGEPVADPAGRARETAPTTTTASTGPRPRWAAEPRTAYAVSLRSVARRPRPRAQRSFAVAEALAHLRRLAGEGRAEPAERDGHPAFRARSAPR